MDNLERYEDSYAIAEEFREWILHIGEKNENLRDSFLNLPKELKELFKKYDIDYSQGNDFKEKICLKQEKDFFKELINYLNFY